MKIPRWLSIPSSLLLLLVFGSQIVFAQTSYIVSSGDTLVRIASRFGTTIAAIVTLNDISNPNLIYVGQTLLIPDGSQPPAPPPAGPTATAVPPAATQPPPTAGTTYVVQPGDTMYRIATRFGTTVAAVAAANNIQNVSFIYVGQVLTIPGSSSPPPAAPPPATVVPPAATQLPPPPPTQPPPPPPAPPSGQDMLTNSSFEGGWYHLYGLPELQLPNSWGFEWDEGPTGFGNESWDVWVRPEVRVLPSQYIPPHEHALFIFDGDQTVKVFKGSGAISYRVFQDVTLTPGTYHLEINVFPDLVVDYQNGQKIWATDPTSGELRFIVGGGGSGWISPSAGQKNTLSHTFTVNSSQTLRIGLGLRGRYALDNNGWFIDDWSLTKLQ